MKEKLDSLEQWCRRHVIISFSLASLGITLLAYCLFLPRLGIYGDDPNELWAYHRGGAAEFKVYLKWIRDYGYLVYTILSPFFQESIMGWRILSIVLRWSACILSFCIFRRLLNKTELLSAGIALCTLLYPGFTQQVISVTYIYHLVPLNFVLLSLWLVQCGLASGKRTWLFFLLAAVFETMGLFISEYFVGLVFLCPFLIWNELRLRAPKEEKNLPLIKRAFLLFLPFLAIFIWFIIWRTFFSQSSYMHPSALEHLSANPTAYIGQLVLTVLHDFKVASIDAWGLIFMWPNSLRFGLLCAVVMFLAFCIMTIYFLLAGKDSLSSRISDKQIVWLLLLGLFIFTCSGLPVWAAELPVMLSLFWDRMTLIFMYGAAIIICALLYLVVRKRLHWLAFSLLITLTTVYQFQVCNRYVKQWNVINNFYWQLQWRAPDIEEHTMILNSDFPVDSITNNSLNALLNWNYETPEKPAAEPLAFLNIEAQTHLLSQYQADKPVSHNAFTGNTSDSLLIHYTSGTCLNVLDLSDVYNPSVPLALREALHLSNKTRIIEDPRREVRFQNFMGREPAHSWCWYYEKAELALDHQNMDGVLALGKEAFTLGLRPNSAYEMTNFIKAALLAGDAETLAVWTPYITAEPGNARHFQEEFEEFFAENDFSAVVSEQVDAIKAYYLKDHIY